MLKAVFSRFGEEIELTDELWQYDFGQKIQVTGIELPDVCEVHFQYDNLTETKTVTGYKQEDALIIDIPNEALTSRGIIKMYIYLVSSEEGRTVNVAIMHVNRRMKPEGFEVPEDIDLFHHTLLAANEYMQQTKSAKKSAETAANQAEDAKKAAEKAKIGTAADRETAETASKAARISATSAEESAKKAEAAKEEIQESADQIQKNTEDIAGLEETVSTAGISVTEAGTGIVVPECTGGKLQGLKMYGKSEQVQYSGKNLFNVSDTTNNFLTKNGIKINEVDQQNGIIKAEFSLPYQQLGVMINSSANTTYTLSFKQKNSKNNEIEVRSYYVKNDVIGDNIKQVVISSEEASFTFTVLNDSYIVVYFRPKGNYSSSDTNVCEFTNIQLERNASSTDFEPYVGGKPSPSPDYPQEIKYVENPTLMIHTKNIVKDVYVIETTTQYSSALLIDADIQGDTEYMLSFIAPEGLRVYVNENLCSYKLIKGTGKIQSVPIKTIKTISKDNVNQFNTNRQKWMLYSEIKV